MDVKLMRMMMMAMMMMIIIVSLFSTRLRSVRLLCSFFRPPITFWMPIKLSSPSPSSTSSTTRSRYYLPLFPSGFRYVGLLCMCCVIL